MSKYRWASGRLFVVLFLICGSLLADEFESAQLAFERGHYAEALRLLEPLAQSGDPRAENLLGLLYHFGQGVPEDDEKAFELFDRAANAGLAEAFYNRANMLMYGYGLPPGIHDPETEAVRDYVSAATSGYAEAQYVLGLLLLSGKVLRRDAEEATLWMRRAADQGHDGAREFLAE